MIRVQVTKTFQDIVVSIRKIQELIKTICRRFDLSKAAISVAIVDNAQMRILNRHFLGRDASTD